LEAEGLKAALGLVKHTPLITHTLAHTPAPAYAPSSDSKPSPSPNLYPDTAGVAASLEAEGLEAALELPERSTRGQQGPPRCVEAFAPAVVREASTGGGQVSVHDQALVVL